MFSRVGSFGANPFAFNANSGTGNTRRSVEPTPAVSLFGQQGGGNELGDIDNLFGSIFGGGSDGGNPFDIGAPYVPPVDPLGGGGRGRQTARSYLSGFFQTNPAGPPVEVPPLGPQLFGTYE